jgi:hypothetical protein
LAAGVGNESFDLRVDVAGRDDQVGMVAVLRRLAGIGRL